MMVNLDLLGVVTSSLRDQCNLLQIISRKLKAKRSEAHPERLIGVATSVDDGGGTGSDDVSLIVHNVSLILPRLHQFAREQPSYFKFFYLSLLLDLLKAAEQHPLLLNDLFSHENDGNHQHWLCTHSCCMKLFDLVRFIVINQEKWIETAASLMLEAGTYFRSITIQKEEKLVIATVVTSKFVDDVLDMETITAYLIATLSILNGLLKYIIAVPEQQHQTTQASVLHQFVQSLGDSLLETVHKVSTGLFINKLSGNDKELIETLLFVTEIELRLKHIMTSYPVFGTAFHPICTALCDHMQQVGLNAVTSFVLFLTCISFDVNVLCDYLCSPETPALQYLLRMTKIFHQYLTTSMDTPMELEHNSILRINIPLIHLCTTVHALSSHETCTLPPPPTLHTNTIACDNDDHRVMIWIGNEHSRTVDVLPTANDSKEDSEDVSNSSNSSSNSNSKSNSTSTPLRVDLPIFDRTNVTPIRVNLKTNDSVSQTNDNEKKSFTVVINHEGIETSSSSHNVLVNELYDNIVTFFSGNLFTNHAPNYP